MKIDQKIFDALRAMPVFKPEMRQANRDGRKSQTRRVMMPQPIATTGFWKGLHWANDGHFRKGAVEHCPYGKAEDFCYMREPMVRIGAYAWYKDDGRPVISKVTGEMLKWRWKKDVLTSIFMPKEAARFIYQYESIGVELVQGISEADALAEGIVKNKDGFYEVALPEEHAAKSVSCNTAQGAYQVLFDAINEKRGFGWNENPWVWVLGYKPIKLFSPGTVGNDKAGLKHDFVIFDDFLGA